MAKSKKATQAAKRLARATVPTVKRPVRKAAPAATPAKTAGKGIETPKAPTAPAPAPVKVPNVIGPVKAAEMIDIRVTITGICRIEAANVEDGKAKIQRQWLGDKPVWVDPTTATLKFLQ